MPFFTVFFYFCPKRWVLGRPKKTLRRHNHGRVKPQVRRPWDGRVKPQVRRPWDGRGKPQVRRPRDGRPTSMLHKKGHNFWSDRRIGLKFWQELRSPKIQLTSFRGRSDRRIYEFSNFLYNFRVFRVFSCIIYCFDYFMIILWIWREIV